MVGVRAWWMLAACSAWATACAPPCVDDGLHAKQHGSACVTTTTTTTTASSTGATTGTSTSTTTDSDSDSDSSTGDATIGLTSDPTTSTTGDTSTGTSSSDSSSSTGGDHCANKLVDGDETDLDCGGSCAPCPDADGCIDGADCQSKACHKNGVCVPLQCDNGVFDPGEGHVDCGALCGKTCDLGAPCASDTDCFAGTCIEGKRCALDPLCVTGELEASETDYDCGGVCGPTCEFEQQCKVAGDCISDACVDSVCENQAQCMNNMQDGGETDIDCGGPCKGCPVGLGCIVKADCLAFVNCVGMVCE